MHNISQLSFVYFVYKQNYIEVKRLSIEQIQLKLVQFILQQCEEIEQKQS